MKRYAGRMLPLLFALGGAYAVQRSFGSFATLARVQPRRLGPLAVALLYPLFVAAHEYRAVLTLDQSEFGTTVAQSTPWVQSVKAMAAARGAA